MSNIFESLAGRVAIIDMLSLSTREIKNDIMNSEEFIPSLNIQNNFGYNETINIEELYEIIWIGSFPQVVINKNISKEFI